MVASQNNHLILSPPNQKSYMDLHVTTYETADVYQCTCPNLVVSFFSLYFTVLDVAESTWDDLVLGSESPVLVEFWAPWCGPCRLMHPVIEGVAKAYTGRLRCLKLNTDKNRDIATSYGIRSIPTILIFKNGERKEMVIGAVTDTTLAMTVERFL